MRGIILHNESLIAQAHAVASFTFGRLLRDCKMHERKSPYCLFVKTSREYKEII